MLHRFRKAGLIWPTLFALPALAILLGLGVWQMQRKAWKDMLIAQIRERTTAEPVAPAVIAVRMTATLEPGRGKANVSAREGVEYTRVRASGRFAHQHEQYLYAPDPFLGPGYHVYTPLLIDGAPCPAVIVNRGFVPEPLKAPEKRVAGQQTVEVIGLVRLTEKPGAFTPANDAKKNNWYWRDLDGMAAAMQLREKSCAMPFFVDALAQPANPGGWPKGGTTILKIPNRHFEYALTWFGLAATLIGVFIAFAAGRLRKA